MFSLSVRQISITRSFFNPTYSGKHAMRFEISSDTGHNTPSTYGNLFNIRMYTGASMSYVTTGQNVPDDIEVFDTQRIVKRLLGGK